MLLRTLIFGAALAGFQLQAADLKEQFGDFFKPKEEEIKITPKLIGEYFLEKSKAVLKSKEKVNIIKFEISDPHWQFSKSNRDKKIYSFLISIASSLREDISREERQRRDIFLAELRNITGVQWLIRYDTKQYYSGDEQESYSYLEISGFLS